MRRNNMWNRIFHNKEIKKNIAECNKFLTLNNQGQQFLDAISKANSLYRVLEIHRDAWGTGFQNENIGPCSYGMFRTKDILTMTAEEVYLGGIWGLFTQNIPFWEERKEDKYGCNGFGLNENLSLYEMIVGQYRKLLSSNIRVMFNNARNNYSYYKSLGY